MIGLNYPKNNKSGRLRLFNNKQMNMAELTVLHELNEYGSVDIDEFRKKHGFNPLFHIASINTTLASLGLKVICYGESLDLEEIDIPSPLVEAGELIFTGGKNHLVDTV